jgi:hypothetical protein
MRIVARQIILNASRGVVYQCYGDKYGEMCYYSILSLRAWGGQCKDFPVTVFYHNTKWAGKISEIKNVIAISVEPEDIGFKKWNRRTDRKLREKILTNLPYQTTLRLDSDTLILRDPIEMFNRAESCGIAAVLDLWAPGRRSLHGDMIQQFNGGVICFKKSVGTKIAQRIKKLLKDGLTREDYAADQPILNTAINDLSLSACQMPRKFNQPGITENDIISHWYSFAGKDKKIMDSVEFKYSILESQKAQIDSNL